MSASLTLHSTSLAPHLNSLHSLHLALQTLLTASSPFYHGLHSVHNTRFFHTLLTLLASSSSVLSALSAAATESTADARYVHSHLTQSATPILAILHRRATHSAWRLSDLASQFRHLSREAAHTAALLDDAEAAFRAEKGALGKLVEQYERDAMQQRCMLRHADASICEMDALIKQAKSDCCIANMRFVLAVCVGVFTTPLRAVGMSVGDEAKKIVAVQKRKRRASAIVDRCLSDRIDMLIVRGFEATNFMRKATRASNVQRDLLINEACVRTAVEHYAALRSLETTLLAVAVSLECLAESCTEAASSTDGLCKSVEDVENYVQDDISLTERWHTISVALRLFRTEQFDIWQRALCRYQHL